MISTAYPPCSDVSITTYRCVQMQFDMYDMATLEGLGENAKIPEEGRVFHGTVTFRTQRNAGFFMGL